MKGHLNQSFYVKQLDARFSFIAAHLCTPGLLTQRLLTALKHAMEKEQSLGFL